MTPITDEIRAGVAAQAPEAIAAATDLISHALNRVVDTADTSALDAITGTAFHDGLARQRIVDLILQHVRAQQIADEAATQRFKERLWGCAKAALEKAGEVSVRVITEAVVGAIGG